MDYMNRITDAFQGKRMSTNATVAIAAGIAIGAVVGALFLTKRGQMMKGKMQNYGADLYNRLIGNTKENAQGKLGELIDDVRDHIRKNAEGLLGPENERKNLATVLH